MRNYNQLLSEISHSLIKAGNFHDELAPAIAKYTEMLFEITNVSAKADAYREHIVSNNGQAIGTFWAALCVKEIFRTQRFVRGLYYAIKDCLLHKNDEPVHVIYAGTGPFATLALPIMSLFSAKEVQFTLLEINKDSYDKMLQVIHCFGFERYIKHAEIADATTWKLNNNNVDIVLSETMNRALIKEPQVSIMLNFAKQLGVGICYIPSQISIGLNCTLNNQSESVEIANLLTFNKSYMHKVCSNSNDNNWLFEKKEVKVDLKIGQRLFYSTNISVYKEDQLLENDCSLNLREYLKGNFATTNSILNFSYQVSKSPGFVVS